jgi:hypothetical protein
MMIRMRARSFLVAGVMATAALGAGEARAQVGDAAYCHNYAESVSRGTGGAGRGADRGAAAGAIVGGAAGGLRRSGSKKRAYQAAYNNCMRGE